MCQWIGKALVQIMAGAYSAPSHFLNQCWFISNWTLVNKLQWNCFRNLYIFVHENAFANVVWRRATILSASMYWIKSTGTWPRNELQWLQLKILEQDCNQSKRHWDDIPHWPHRIPPFPRVFIVDTFPTGLTAFHLFPGSLLWTYSPLDSPHSPFSLGLYCGHIPHWTHRIPPFTPGLYCGHISHWTHRIPPFAPGLYCGHIPDWTHRIPPFTPGL